LYKHVKRTDTGTQVPREWTLGLRIYEWPI